DGGDAEAEADDGVGGGASTLAEDAFAAREPDDVPDDQEVAGHAELANHVELVGDLGPIEGRGSCAARGKRSDGLGESAAPEGNSGWSPPSPRRRQAPLPAARFLRALPAGGGAAASLNPGMRSTAPLSTNRARYSSAVTPGGSGNMGSVGRSSYIRNAQRSAMSSVARRPSGCCCQRRAICRALFRY